MSHGIFGGDFLRKGKVYKRLYEERAHGSEFLIVQHGDDADLDRTYILVH